MNVIHKYFSAIFLLSILSVSTIANATLAGRDLDGNLTTAEAYYDDVTNLTWLSDANASGAGMVWATANSWANGLTLGGYTDWHLPNVLQPDANCSHQDGSDSLGYNCTGSEMDNLFYNVLGGSVASSITVTHNANYDLFSNIPSYFYWTSMEYASNTSSAWFFNFEMGNMGYITKSAGGYAWAVHSGDVGVAVSTVPVPAAVWLFGSGFMGLMALTRRKKA